MKEKPLREDHAQGNCEAEYRELLSLNIPLYATRLVRIADISFGERYQVRTPEDIAVVMQEYFRDKAHEEFLIICLDTANTVTSIVQISIGGLAASIVEPRAVFGAAINAYAASLILCHAHPSGNPEPSREDIRITRQLAECGKLLGIPVRDHLIIAENTYTSLAERGLIETS